MIGKRRPVDAAFLIGRSSKQGANLGQLSAIAHGEYRAHIPFVLAFVARNLSRPHPPAHHRVYSLFTLLSYLRSLSPSSPFPLRPPTPPTTRQLRLMKTSVCERTNLMQDA